MAENLGNPLWVKGMASPNPKGRPKLTPEMLEARDLARDLLPKGIAQMWSIVEHGTKDGERVAAFKIIVEVSGMPKALEVRQVDEEGETIEMQRVELDPAKLLAALKASK